MQNLPVTATPPIISAQAPAAADGTAQATEPFGNVLARQQASICPPDGKQSHGKQGASSGEPQAAAGKNAGDELQAQMLVSDAAGAIPGDILAALMPAAAAMDKPLPDDKSGMLDNIGKAGKTDKTGKTDKANKTDKAELRATPRDGAGVLSGDMPAMLLPAATVIAKESVATAGGKSIPEGATGEMGKARSPQIETVTAGKIPRHTEGKTSTQPLAISGDAKNPRDSRPVLSRIQGEKSESAAAVNANKDKTFVAALEASRAGAKIAQTEVGLTKAHAQPDPVAAAGSLLQGGNAAPAAAQSGVAQAAINTPVTDRAWGDEFNQKITWMATQQQQTAELHLNPPNLGPLDVVLNVSGDQATALFTSPHAAVRDAVEQALPRLRDMMADNGITLGNATVSDQSPQERQAWQAGQQERNGGTSGRMDPGIVTAAVSTATAVPVRRHLGMVDTFA